MMPARHLRATPFVLAIAVAVAVVLSAPFVGQLRTWIRTTFPGHFVLIVGAIGATVLGAALVAAALRIRERRALRYGTIATALVIAAVYSLWNAGAYPESNAVERFHFLEYGLITFLFYRAWRPLGDLAIVLLPVLAGLIVGTAEEWFQWFIPGRVGELRDVFLNLVAIGCGLLFSVAVQPPAQFQPTVGRDSVPRICRMAAATVFVLGVFIHVLHLGYAITDDETGTFRSRYSADRLPALQQQKAVQWQTDPPPLVVQRFSREDQYLSEGIEHVMHRNELWAAGDISGAWYENRILEKYFVPVLDTPTYAGKSGHRWPADQRADAQARAGVDPRSGAVRPFRAAQYVSDAYPYPIYTVNKAVFWVIVGGMVALLLIVAMVRGQD